MKGLSRIGGQKGAHGDSGEFLSMGKKRDLDQRAADYVLGTLPDSDRRAFERDMERNPALKKAVDHWEWALAPLSDGAPEAKPPPELWARIENVLDTEKPSVPRAGGHRTSDLFHFVLADQGEWVPLGDGLAKKVLLTDPGGAWETYLLRIDPGHVIPAHDHNSLEECLVVSGDLRVGDFRFGPGDFHAIGAGHSHPDIQSDKGAVILLRGEIRHAPE